MTAERSVVRRAALSLGAAGVGFVAYGCAVERRWYRLRRLTLPGSLRRPGRLRILHISDLHFHAGQEHRVRFLAEIAREEYDLVVATGDLLGAAHAEMATVEAMAPLTHRGRPGLVVLGSNDLFAPVPKSPFSYFTRPERRVYGTRLHTEALVAGLADAGYRTLRDEVALIDTDAGLVAAGGMDDPHLDPADLPDAAMLMPPQDGGDPLLHLGIVHAPYVAALDVLADAGHDLLLAGHTHGGQVRLPGIGALVGNCDLPLDRIRGASRFRGRWLHVSPGLGHSRYAPFRFACRPEATILELTA